MNRISRAIALAAASFGTTAGRTFGDSAFALLQLGRALVLVAIALLTVWRRRSQALPQVVVQAEVAHG
jgi:hypothetical protein